MAVGRENVDQTGEAKRPGYVTAIQGRDGRIAAPPKGDLYVRDPAAARAQAIRDRVALHKELKQPIPKHLQEMFDELPDEDGTRPVELVDAVTGGHVAEVDLEAPPDKVQHNLDQVEVKLKSTDIEVPVDPEPPVETFEKHDVSAEPVDGPTGTVVDGVVEPQELAEAEPAVEVGLQPMPEGLRKLLDEPVDVEVEPEVEPASGGEGALTADAQAVEVEPTPEPELPTPPAPMAPKPGGARPAPRRNPRKK